jgi:hypothetical protein
MKFFCESRATSGLTLIDTKNFQNIPIVVTNAQMCHFCTGNIENLVFLLNNLYIVALFDKIFCARDIRPEDAFYAS